MNEVALRLLAYAVDNDHVVLSPHLIDFVPEPKRGHQRRRAGERLAHVIEHKLRLDPAERRHAVNLVLPVDVACVQVEPITQAFFDRLLYVMIYEPMLVEEMLDDLCLANP